MGKTVIMNDLFIDKWEKLTEIWHPKGLKCNSSKVPEPEDKKILHFQFECRRALYGLQNRNYNIEVAWKKVCPKNSYKHILFKVYKYAAIFILCMGLIYWSNILEFPNTNSGVVTNDSIVPIQGTAKFILSTGEELEIDIHQKIYISDFNGLTIANDTVKGRIDYQYTNGKRKATGFNTFIVPKGGVYSLKLSDGTIVWLNSQSSLRFPESFTSDKREVYLEGEAYFQVAKNKESPFLVHTKDYSIKVLGTSFNVCAYTDDEVCHTTLVEGAVFISGKDEKVLLKPNEQYQTNSNSQYGIIETVSPELYTSWINGKFYFKAYTLENLIKKLQRYYDFKILYTNEDIKKRQFSGVIYIYRPLQEMLRFLEMTSDVNFDIKGNTITATFK